MRKKAVRPKPNKVEALALFLICLFAFATAVASIKFSQLKSCKNLAILGDPDKSRLSVRGNTLYITGAVSYQCFEPKTQQEEPEAEHPIIRIVGEK